MSLDSVESTYTTTLVGMEASGLLPNILLTVTIPKVKPYFNIMVAIFMAVENVNLHLRKESLLFANRRKKVVWSR